MMEIIFTKKELNRIFYEIKNRYMKKDFTNDDMNVINILVDNFVYYDLIEIKYRDGMVVHIPVPFFLVPNNNISGSIEITKSNIFKLIDFLIELKYNGRIRDNEFFECECGEKSFYKCDNYCDYYEFEDVYDEEYCYNYWRRERSKRMRKVIFVNRLLNSEKMPKSIIDVAYIPSRYYIPKNELYFQMKRSVINMGYEKNLEDKKVIAMKIKAIHIFGDEIKRMVYDKSNDFLIVETIDDRVFLVNETDEIAEIMNEDIEDIYDF